MDKSRYVQPDGGLSELAGGEDCGAGSKFPEYGYFPDVCIELTGENVLRVDSLSVQREVNTPGGF